MAIGELLVYVGTRVKSNSLCVTDIRDAPIAYLWTVSILRFAAGSFHTKKLCNQLCSIKIEFYSKQKKTTKIAYWAILWGF